MVSSFVFYSFFKILFISSSCYDCINTIVFIISENPTKKQKRRPNFFKKPFTPLCF